MLNSVEAIMCSIQINLASQAASISSMCSGNKQQYIKDSGNKSLASAQWDQNRQWEQNRKWHICSIEIIKSLAVASAQFKLSNQYQIELGLHHKQHQARAASQAASS